MNKTERLNIADAQEEANKLLRMIKAGLAKDYPEAYEKLKAFENQPEEFKFSIDLESNVYMSAGGNRIFLGNPYEGAKNKDGKIDQELVAQNMKKITDTIKLLVSKKPKDTLLS